ncbi:MAG TPA: hypothetical protein VKU83_02815 [Puia sp.]|nr:hypothetical protein [Puia sp.]
MRFPFNRAMAFLVLSSAVVFAAASCKKSGTGNSGATLSASVSGTAWTPNYPTAAYYATSGSQFNIVGLYYKNGDSTAFVLDFFSPVNVNQAINSDTSNIDVQYVVAKPGSTQVYDGSYMSGGHAILTVTSYDSTGHKIAGTFSGVLYNVSGGTDSVLVTNGAFNTSYSVQ